MADYKSTILASKPVRYYRLSETSGSAIDLGSDGVNGTYQTGGTRGATGLLTNDADAALKPTASAGGVTAATPANITGDFTAEFWFNRPANSTTAYILNCLSSVSPFYQTFVFSLGGYPGGAANKLAFGYGQTSTTFTACFGPVITLGKTYHVIANYQASTFTRTLIINGAFFSQLVSAFGPAYNQAGESMAIGLEAGSLNNWFDGTVDEVALYNRILPADEALWHYNVGVGQRVLGAMGVG